MFLSNINTWKEQNDNVLSLKYEHCFPVNEAARNRVACTAVQDNNITNQQNYLFITCASERLKSINSKDKKIVQSNQFQSCLVVSLLVSPECKHLFCWTNSQRLCQHSLIDGMWSMDLWVRIRELERGDWNRPLVEITLIYGSEVFIDGNSSFRYFSGELVFYYVKHSFQRNQICAKLSAILRKKHEFIL